MSIHHCQYCESNFDTDWDATHEEDCVENPENMKREQEEADLLRHPDDN